jgi:hypothetical protein
MHDAFEGYWREIALRRLKTVFLLVLVLALPWDRAAHAYSVLTHEQLIDLTWNDSIVPLLLSRYPDLTPAQPEHARAYAYGGCVIQDIGYYPFGDGEFSNLTHYVRTGDFVVSLFRNAKNANELAFAIGALSHYIGDSVGHSDATNKAVPVEFPELRAKYGPVVNFAEGKHQHVQTEFAFDIDEIAHHRMAPLQFLRHVGLGVPERQIGLAYYQTYGLSETFGWRKARRINAGGYRFAVRAFIPRIAYALTILHRKHEPADPNTPEALEIEKEVAVVATENDWQAYRRKAGIGTYMLAGLIFILPKLGPLKLVDIKGPTAATEADYLKSVALSTAELRRRLARFTPPSKAHDGAALAKAEDPKARLASAHGQVSDSGSPKDLASSSPSARPALPNRDLDTGYVVQPGGYSLTDKTFAWLLHRLTRQPALPIPPGIKKAIQAYYANPAAPITTKKDAKKWAQVQADLATLGTMPTSAAPEPYPTYGEDVDDGQ